MELEYISGCDDHGLSRKGCNSGHYCQLNTYDYLADIPGNEEITDLVEFIAKLSLRIWKNTMRRKLASTTP